MRLALSVLILAFVVMAACGGDPVGGNGGGGCGTGNGQYSTNGSCVPGVPSSPTPTPTPSPTPTPTATPTAWPHSPTYGFDGQFGGLGVSAATVDANYTFCEYTIQGFTGGVQKAITDCTSNAEPVLYVDPTRVDSETGSTLGQAFASNVALSGGCPALVGGTADACYLHLIGASPTPVASNPPAKGQRTAPACINGVGNPTCYQINNFNPLNATAVSWWVAAFQGTQTAGPNFTNANTNLFHWLRSDTDDAYFPHVTQQPATGIQEITTQAAYEAARAAFHRAWVHGGPGDPFAGAPFKIFTNSMQFGQAGNPGKGNNGVLLNNSCNVFGVGTGSCLDSFGGPYNDVVSLQQCEFCIQNGGSGTTRTMFPTFVPYFENVASQVDAIPSTQTCCGISLRSTQMCPVSGSNPSGGCGSNGANFVSASITDRMFHFAAWFLAYDTSSNFKNPAGESIEAVSEEDFNNHSTGTGSNENSLSVFDEQYIEPIGAPSVQASAYVNGIPCSSAGANCTPNPTQTPNGFGSCNTQFLVPESHGLDDYLIANSCDSSGSKRLGVYKKCYHHFSYHNQAFGDICVFLNLRQTAGAYTIVGGDLTGYSLTHTYAPMSTCAASPYCGDYVTGGLPTTTVNAGGVMVTTLGSTCPGGNGYGGSNGCSGSITIPEPGNTLVGVQVPANGGVVVATP